jgi:hypothetical protein
MENKHKHAIDNAAAWYDTIRTALQDWHDAHDTTAEDDRYSALLNLPLDVSYRSGWQQPGDNLDPAEMQILLSTGGPACRIYAMLGAHYAVKSATIQWQDWGTQWEDWYPPCDNVDDIPAIMHRYDSVLIEFAEQFASCL